MYEYILGKLVCSTPTYCVIDCNGIGYNILISINTYSVIKDMAEVKLFLHHVVREDDESLYGFYEEKERLLFRFLISVSGVGANTARLILSSLTADELYSIIVESDYKRLKTVKGVGEKTAQRIVVDLSDKLTKIDFYITKMPFSYNNNSQEALSALVVLGFPKATAEKALKKIFEKKGTGLPVEELVKEALRIM